MTIRELFSKDRDQMQGMSPKEKARHIWHYYKWYFVVFLLVVIYIGSTISAYITTSRYVLNGLFLNVTAPAYVLSDISEDFLPGDGEETLYLDTLFLSAEPDPENATTVYESFQTLIAKAHAGDLDFLVTDDSALNQLIYNEFYLDLSQFLTEEEMAAYEGKLLYMDRAFLERIRQLDVSTDLTVPIKYPDPAKPEAMEDPVPVLIDIRNSPYIAALYPNDTGLHAFGLVTNGQHPQTALDFLAFLLNGAKN